MICLICSVATSTRHCIKAYFWKNIAYINCADQWAPGTNNIYQKNNNYDYISFKCKVLGEKCHTLQFCPFLSPTPNPQNWCLQSNQHNNLFYKKLTSLKNMISLYPSSPGLLGSQSNILLFFLFFKWESQNLLTSSPHHKHSDLM